MNKYGIILNIIGDKTCPDDVIFNKHIEMAMSAESYGYDSIFAMEHHTTDYCMSPDPIQLLSFLAGKLESMILGTAVLVLPWHNPIQLAERISILNILNQGRCIFCFGRSSSIKEYELFNVPMKESNSLFIENLEIIVKSLTNQSFSFKGSKTHYNDISLRPFSKIVPEEQFFGASGNNVFLKHFSENGFGLMKPVTKDWEDMEKDLAIYNNGFLRKNSHILLLMVFVAPTKEIAYSEARKYFYSDLKIIDKHYEYSSNKLNKIDSYETYKKSNEFYSKLNDYAHVESQVELSIKRNIVGSPNDCILKIKDLLSKIEVNHLVFEFAFGNMNQNTINKNFTLFSEEVLPKIKD